VELKGASKVCSFDSFPGDAPLWCPRVCLFCTVLYISLQTNEKKELCASFYPEKCNRFEISGWIAGLFAFNVSSTNTKSDCISCYFHMLAAIHYIGLINNYIPIV